MPTTKNRTYKKRRPRRRPKSKTNVKNLERRITRIEHSQELKYDFVHPNFSPVGPSTAGALSLTNIGQGDDYNQRIGEQITAKYLNLHLKLTHGAAPTADALRVMIFWDKQNNGGTTITFLTSVNAAEGVFDDSSISVPSQLPRNYRTKDRYVFLLDKVITINADSSSVDKIVTLRRNFKLGNARIKYSDSGSTSASLPSRELLFAVFADGSIATTQVNGIIRFWYTDS